MQPGTAAEAEAIRKLIRQIDDLDAWRDRIGRRIIALFLTVFAGALMLLFYVAAYAHPPQNLPHPGPRVPGVLRGVRG